MRRLSSIIAGLGLICSVFGQSPHGEALQVDCAQCHNPSGWTVSYAEVVFDHDETGFPLEGMHDRTECRDCHQSMVFSEVQSTCVDCHTDVHSMSVGNDCARCHSPQSWLVDEIPELHEMNGFPLMGAHGSLSCVECHINETNLRFDRIGNECIECHQDDYVNARNPVHVNSGFSTNCVECHNPLGFGWMADPIAHDFFPLVDGHDIQDCSQCHNPGTFTDLSSDCFSCHAADYQATVNPDHEAASFPTDCNACHSLAPGWRPATVEHDFFPLVDGHDIQDCAACHTNGNFNNTPTDCFECHSADYQASVDPDHDLSGFSTDCASCHTLEPGWRPSTIDHDGDYFPIFSGPHNDVWDACTDCHSSGGNYAIFSCFKCHTPGNTDNKHDDVPNYTYESNACFACHPTGEED